MNLTFENNNTNRNINFFLSHKYEYLLYVFLNIFGIVVGVVGNVIVLGSYWCTNFFLSHKYEYLLYVFLNIFGIVVGVVGNVIVLGSYWCTKELWNNTNTIIANLAVADIILCGINDSLALAGKLDKLK